MDGLLKMALMRINQTNDENPGNGARDLAMLFIIIWPPLRLITALPSGSESV